MERVQIRGLILAEAVNEESLRAVESLREAGLSVTLVCADDSARERLFGSAEMVHVQWNSHFAQALNTALDTFRCGEWVFRVDTDEQPPADLSARLKEALAYADEQNTDAMVVPVVEWKEDSYRPICSVRMWRHSNARRYRGAASEVVYDLPTGLPLHRAFYPLAPTGLVLGHTPSPSRDWHRHLRREWIKNDPESKFRARVLELNDLVDSQAPGWKNELTPFFSGLPSTVTMRMLHGGSLSLVLLADFIFSRSQETLMNETTVQLVESCLGVFGWSPFVLFSALRVLAVSDYRGQWLETAQQLRAEMSHAKPIFHSIFSAEMQAAMDQYLEVIERDVYDFRSLDYRCPLRMSAVLHRHLPRWDRLGAEGLS